MVSARAAAVMEAFVGPLELGAKVLHKATRKVGRILRFRRDGLRARVAWNNWRTSWVNCTILERL